MKQNPWISWNAAAVFLAAASAGAVLAQESSPPPPSLAASANGGDTPSSVTGPAQVSLIDTKSIDLGAAYPVNPAAAGRTFRARKIALAPGARTETLGAPGIPAIYYVTRGEVIENKSNGTREGKVLHMAGAVSGAAPVFIENASIDPAEILVVDIESGE